MRRSVLVSRNMLELKRRLQCKEEFSDVFFDPSWCSENKFFFLKKGGDFESAANLDRDDASTLYTTSI
jgi:hypothetical protein